MVLALRNNCLLYTSSQVFGTLGPKLIAIAILLFAYSTVLGLSLIHI